ncbi:putative lipase atg15, partial [Lunasporangiospora selenospora]
MRPHAPTACLAFLVLTLVSAIQAHPFSQSSGPHDEQVLVHETLRTSHSYTPSSEQAQVPFSNRRGRDHSQHPVYQPKEPRILVAGQSLPEETLTLRHMLHRGGVRYPGLFRRKDISKRDVQLSELSSGQSLSHRLKVRATTSIKPRDQSFRSQGFRSAVQKDQSIGPESWSRQVVPAPDMSDKETIVQLGKMNYNSYTEVESPGWYDLEGHWKVNTTFGWEEDGVRGHIFASEDNSTMVIAIKGTSAALVGGGGATAPRDKINDNLLFSCCCAKVDRTWRPVCDCNTGGYNCDQKCVEDSVNSDDVYYGTAMSILWAIQDLYPDADVWLTGHSLGGGLSALLGLTFGVPTTTFEAPGDRLAAQRLHLPMPPVINWEDFPLFQVGHTADPIFQGVCNGPSSTCYFSGFAME